MSRPISRWTGGGLLLSALVATGCMTFEATMPGTLDMRKELALAQDAPMEPFRPAFASMDDSYFEGFVFGASTDAPTKGEYIAPRPAEPGRYVTPEAPANATIYRRLLRQWVILGLFPVGPSPEDITADLKAELESPGARASNIRITSGSDLVEALKTFVVAPCLSPVLGIGGLIQLVPTRTTEVTAFIEKPNAPAPAADPLPTGTELIEPPPVPDTNQPATPEKAAPGKATPEKTTSGKATPKAKTGGSNENAY